MMLNNTSLAVGEARMLSVDVAATNLQLRHRAGSIKAMNPSREIVQTVQCDKVTPKVDGAALLWDGTDSLCIATA